MATGGGLFKALERRRKPFYDFPCSLCEGEGKHVEADRYCDDCFVFMCNVCIKNHNKFPLNRTHQLLDQSQFVTVTQSKLVSFPTKRCLKHPGEFYCGEHDVVCCGACKVLYHTNCDNTKYLIDVAKGIHESKEYQSIKQETRAFLNDADRVLADRKADISRIEHERQDVKRIIVDFRKKVNKYFDDLEQTTLDALNDKAEVIISSCKQDTKVLTITKSTAEVMLKQLESFKGDNECDLFLQVKTGMKFLSNATQDVLTISKTVKKDAINFRIDPNIERYFSSVEMFGTFTDIPINASQLSSVATNTHERQSCASTPSSQTSPDNRSPLPKYKAQLYGKFDVREKSESTVCDVSSILQLPDGTILLADFGNKKLKRLDQSYKLLDSLRLPDEPECICNVGPDEVAVSLCFAEKVQFISVKEKLSLTWSFSTGDFCRGIVYVDDKLYVCCGDTSDSGTGCIEVYNNAGQLHHSICGISFVPHHITVTDDGQHLLVTSWNSDKITMMNRTKFNTFNYKYLKEPEGICTDGKGQLFILGGYSNTVVQLASKKVGVMLQKKDGIDNPLAFGYDRMQSRILVYCYRSNQLLVFSLK
ncbi:uncharacterized protein LOC123532494 [Mercenaria mercenaria]|uniref:uncharacterized protein LOC123532494 n=1 Tax=Mercenaria mercenaria TaxID=6596 RepID=UPI00234E9320|nr:uncharacterized protein LOC123532494 [Mercenaria mercenaria]